MPTNNEVMTYNTERHLYVLNHAYLKSTYEIDFVDTTGSETKAKNLCLQISVRVYNYIYNHKLKTKKYWEYFMAFNEEVRDVIQTALIEQALYEYASNASQLQNQIGINLLNGIKINLNDLRGERGIALETVNTLRTWENGLLLFSGREYITTQDYDYTTDGY